jgi:hypothetical protein
LPAGQALILQVAESASPVSKSRLDVWPPS